MCVQLCLCRAYVCVCRVVCMRVVCVCGGGVYACGVCVCRVVCIRVVCVCVVCVGWCVCVW